MGQLFANAAKSTLQAQVTDIDLSLTLADNGAAFPVATLGTGSSGDWFKAVIDDGTNQEVIRVRTHASGSTSFSDLLRGQEGTQAQAWPAGTTIGLRLTAEDFTLATGRRTVASVAEMKEITAPVGSTIETLGYYTPGDGGGAIYQIVAAGTGTQDGGSLITLNNTLQAQALFPGNAVRLSQFGAKGVYESPRTAPDSLGSWTDLGNGSYRLQWDGVSAVTPMTFDTVVGQKYMLFCNRKSALGPVGYDLGLYHGSTSTELGAFGQWFVPQRVSLVTATQTSMQLRPRTSFSGTLDVTLGDFQFVRAENDMAVLMAALAWFGTARTGRLIIDTRSYADNGATNASPVTITVPENVELEFQGNGGLSQWVSYPGFQPLTFSIDATLIADSRPILPTSSSVTFGPRQHSVKSNWFGL